MKIKQIAIAMFMAIIGIALSLGSAYAEGSQREKTDYPDVVVPPAQERDIGTTAATTPTAWKAMIIYYTKTGHTLDAAKDIAAGMKENNIIADIKDVKDVKINDLTHYDLILVRSPCHAGSIPFSSGIAGPIEQFLQSIPRDFLKGKKAGAFSVHSSFGGEKTVSSIEKRLQIAGADVVMPGPAVKAGAFMSLYRGPDYSRLDREKLQRFGEAITGPQLQSAGRMNN
jgi:flavodoxin